LCGDRNLLIFQLRLRFRRMSGCDRMVTPSGHLLAELRRLCHDEKSCYGE
jgi:hypothetical protein